MSIHTLKPWTELVKLHPDVESGSLAEAVFAIDLGAIATGDPTTPTVYRDPDAFFAATYVTTDLRRMLEEVLASLAGQGAYNRVLKLRSPFGGGKPPMPVIDAVATVDGAGKNRAIALVNRHPSETVACTVNLGDRSLDGTFDATILSGDSPEAFNDVERPNRVVPEKTQLKFNQGAVNLPPHSLTIVRIRWK